MNRDDVLDKFSEGTVTKYYNVPAMADEIVVLRNDLVQMERLYRHHVEVSLDAIAKLKRAKAILAKLREPSEAVLDAAVLGLPLVGQIIRAAVEAAEQEVDDDAR